MAESADRVAIAFDPAQIRKAQDRNPFVKISDIVYDILSEAILSSTIAPGSKLNISSIAENLNISHTPVFQAVDQLKNSGLIVESNETSKYHSYRVLDISNESLTNLFTARKAIETIAASICATNVALIDIAHLKKMAAEFRAVWSLYANGQGTSADFADRETLDRAFHNEIVLATENNYLIDMYHSIREPLNYLSVRTCEFIASKRERDNIIIISAQHVDICRAIESGFPEMARQTMGRHIDFCHERCLLDR